MQATFHKKFVKQYEKASPKIKSAFDARLTLFLEDHFNPQLNNHALKGKYKGYRSVNVTGDWRAIYKQETQESVIFVEINTHSNLYS